MSLRTPIRQLLADIGHGAERVVAIVRALKSYTFLDQAPVQTVDLHGGTIRVDSVLRRTCFEVRLPRSA